MKTCKFFPAALLLTLILFGCDRKAERVDVDPAFAAHVSAFTSGVISKASNIVIQLAEPADGAVANERIEKQLFKFTPKIEGETFWVNDRTIEFRPTNPMPSGKLYKVDFKLSEVKEVSKELSTMSFNFQTMKQALFVSTEGVQYYDQKDLRWQRLEGRVNSADMLDVDVLENTLNATQSGRILRITWEHISPHAHVFLVDSVQRGEAASEVLLSWDDEELELEEEGQLSFTVPPLGDFKVMSCKVLKEPAQAVVINFSDPLDATQDLTGLIHLTPSTDARVEINGNEAKFFPSSRAVGTYRITVEKTVRNSAGHNLQEPYSIDIAFVDSKPAVEFISNGSILPSTAGLQLPFRAVNLNAVNVKIIKIHSDNVNQFLQVNDLDGTEQLTRVGMLVYHKAVQLTANKPIDRGAWNNFSLDLTDMIKTEPGAIYRVEMGFDRRQSLYLCDGIDNELAIPTEYMSHAELDNYDQPHRYYYYHHYPNGFNWQEREDPCKDSYYWDPDHIVSRNILASDLGIIAKGNDENKYYFAVTDLRSAKTLKGVDLEVYDLQHQLLGSVKTNGDGMADIELDRKPFMLVAKRGKERGYLRLDDGMALSTSMFNVGGEKLVKGVKGFLYGERGVWRPGDSLYLAFMLEDEMKALPKDHPVVFELFTPQSQLYQRIVRTSSVNGVYDMRTTTTVDAPTGNWLAKVKVGSATFSKSLKIETVKPNRLKIKTDFGGKVLKSNMKKPVEMEVTWLHGAIAKSLKADVEMIVSQGKTSFEKYPDHSFDDPAKYFESEEQMIFDGTLDAAGKATYRPDISVRDNAPGMLNASFKTRVFEKGGDISEDRVVVPYSPFDGYVGIKVPKGKGWNGALYSNEPNIFSVVTVDEDGKKVDRDQLIVEVYDVNWRWWWEYDDEYELAQYVADRSRNLLKTDTIATKNGEGKYELQFDNERWGRKMIRVHDPVTGHTCGETFYMTYSGWWNDPSNNPGGAEMLTFKTDKEKYAPGEEVKIDLPEFKVGRALVSIESGAKVIDHFWVTPEESKNVRFKATPDMTPNVYVNVALVQPHEQVQNDLPIRLYGIQEIKVEDPNTRLHPKITMPNELAPETDFTVKVSEQDGRAMTYTLAVVDDGLLDLTRFQTPDPWARFYTREALGVHTWDMYKHVIGSFSGEMAGLLALGGDGAISPEAKRKAERFKPVVKYVGPFHLKAGQTASHKLTMPNYVGSVRTMVVARHEASYGNTEKTTPVKKPLMVLASLPRVVGPGETVKLPVTVFAMDKKVKDVNVSVSTGDMLSMIGASEQLLSFSELGDQMAYFELKVPEKLGIAKLKVTATGAGEKASYELEVDVRMSNPPVRDVVEGAVEPGATWTGDYTALGMAGTNRGSVEVSALPPIDLEGRLRYLIQYPHGCLEQTSSGLFPQVFLADLVELTPTQKADIQRNVTGGFGRLRSFQNSTGGFGYWPGDDESSPWSTNYVGHFMLEAKAKGYAIPAGMLEEWIAYQKRIANSWTHRDQQAHNGYRWSYHADAHTQAYRLFTLALAGRPVHGAMNRLREMKDLPTAARWRLAAAYHLIQKPEIAEELIRGANTSVEPYQELAYTYGSDTRDEAMILETLTIMGKQSLGKKVLEDLCRSISGDRWYSTQTTAYSLLAIAKFAGSASGNSELHVERIVNGMKDEVRTLARFASKDLVFKAAIGGQVSITNKGDKTVFVTISLEGTPVVGNMTDDENDLYMTVKYLDMAGAPLDPSRLEQGSDLIAEVTIKHPGVRNYYNEMALTQIFPSGWEIRNTRMDLAQTDLMRDKPEYMDIRDDRVYSYFDIGRSTSVTYRTILNAAYLGRFYLPTVYCEAMYDHDINARRAGRWVEVVPAGGK